MIIRSWLLALLCLFLISWPRPDLAVGLADISNFGAACDGATDDHGAIGSALSSLGPIGGTLVIPCHACDFTGTTINVPILVDGVGMGTSNWDNCDHDVNTLELNVLGARAEHITISGQNSPATTHSAYVTGPSGVTSTLSDVMLQYGAPVANLLNETIITDSIARFNYGDLIDTNGGLYVKRAKFDEFTGPPGGCPFPATQSLPPSLPVWQANTSYARCALVVDGGAIIRAITAGTSGASLPTVQPYLQNMNDGSAVWQLEMPVNAAAISATGPNISVEQTDITGIYTYGLAVGGTANDVSIGGLTTFGDILTASVYVKGGTGVVSVRDVLIGACVIEGCSGVAVLPGSGDVRVIGATIVNSHYGIYYGAGSQNLVVQGSTLAANGFGVMIAPNATTANITGNVFYSNIWGSDSISDISLGSGANYMTVANNNCGLAGGLQNNGVGSHSVIGPNVCY